MALYIMTCIAHDFSCIKNINIVIEYFKFYFYYNCHLINHIICLPSPLLLLYPRLYTQKGLPILRIPREKKIINKKMNKKKTASWNFPDWMIYPKLTSLKKKKSYQGRGHGRPINKITSFRDVFKKSFWNSKLHWA